MLSAIPVSETSRLWRLSILSCATAALLALGMTQLPLFSVRLPPSDDFTHALVLAGGVVGLLLPLAGLAYGGRDRIVRALLGTPVLMLLGQIACEGIFSKAFYPAVVIPTALVFLSFRISFLALVAYATQAVANAPMRKAVRAVIWINIGFWTIVWIHLAAGRLPLVLL